MTLLLIIAVVAAAAIGRFSQYRQPVRPILTGTTMILVGGCLVAQLIRPALLPTFERDAAAIWSGQVYRLFTALWFQDDGWQGGLFNLGILACVGAAAEALWDRRLWSTIYLAGGLASEVVALWWEPIGAGNSVACMSLAGSVLVNGLRANERPVTKLVGFVGLVAGLLLAMQADIHGIALLIGAGLGSIFLRFSRGTASLLRMPILRGFRALPAEARTGPSAPVSGSCRSHCAAAARAGRRSGPAS